MLSGHDVCPLGLCAPGCALGLDETLTWELSFGGLGGWIASMLIFLIESLTWKLSFGGLEAWQASAFIFLIESLTWKLSFGGLEDGGVQCSFP